MADRLWSKVDRSGGPDACWPFQGVITYAGYGRIRSGGQGEPTLGAHRAAYIATHPDVEQPEVVDHICHDPDVCDLGNDCPHRRCCNPAHLKASTVAENSAADRQRSKRRETHCIDGHEFDEANTYWWTDSDGHTFRTCRACAARRARERRSA